jgi:modification methylase
MSAEVIHGNCLDVMRGMPDASVDLVLTDIPYGEVSRESGGLRSLDKGTADVLTFGIAEFVAECVRLCRGSLYVFCGIEQVSPLAEAFTAHGLTIRSGVWRKTNPSPMNGERLWLSGIEHCIFARRPRAQFNERCKSAVWDAPVGSSKRHPTEKPLALFTRLLLASTNPGDVVLDPCAGSGTTGEAAIATGRRAILVERKAEYVAVINERLTHAQPALGVA